MIDDKNLFYTNLTLNFFKYCTDYLYGGVTSLTAVRSNNDNNSNSNYNYGSDDDDYEQPMLISQQLLLPFVDLSTNNHSSSNNDNNKSKEPDIWTSNAIRLYSSLRQIMSLLDCHSSGYTYKDVIFSTPKQRQSRDETKCSSTTTSSNGYSNTTTSNSRMNEEEVTIFEASIASFLTSAASQIDTLRQQSMIQEEHDKHVISSFNNNSHHRDGTMSEDVKAHRSGVISHLVCELEQVMRYFQTIQKQRNRVELELYLDPLKCVYGSGCGGGGDDDDNDGDIVRDDILLQRDDWEWNLEPDGDYLDSLEKEEEYFQSMFGLQKNINDDFANDDFQEWRDVLDSPLPFFPIVRQNENHQELKNHLDDNIDREVVVGGTNIQREEMHFLQRPATVVQGDNDDDYKVRNNSRQTEILQQEQIFLNESVQNTELDAAQSIESQMMQITSLLSQFSSLISEQQEEIQMIAGTSATSRMNVTKGKEKLVQATEQKKKSRHYFAWIIFFLGLLLLFLNAIIT
mmetsp:Transcript_5145/g.9774  ORF Transcript_5145/g.9774 Transcript_5145/m.9774 type:complete len:514 (-) Transcript_5145:28-1569(-)